MTDPIKAEPVAWLYSSPFGIETCSRRWATDEGCNSDNWIGWTETPLYTEAQLVEERRLAWNEAIEAAINKSRTWCPSQTGVNTVGDRLRLDLRALTKDSTHD